MKSCPSTRSRERLPSSLVPAQVSHCSKHSATQEKLTAMQGICLAFTEQLLEGGCSVILADLKLRPEAEAVVAKYSSAGDGKPKAVFKETDVCDWAQITSLWNTALETFGKVHIVCNGAGIWEPPSSSFWKAPGISPSAQDKADASPGVYQTIAINTMAPMRLSQIAIDYWIKNSDVEGNLLCIASVGGYIHAFQTPFYFASKAAIVSFVKCLAPLRKRLNIRNAAICPGAVKVKSPSWQLYLTCPKSC